MCVDMCVYVMCVCVMCMYLCVMCVICVYVSIRVHVMCMYPSVCDV